MQLRAGAEGLIAMTQKPLLISDIVDGIVHVAHQGTVWALPCPTEVCCVGSFKATNEEAKQYLEEISRLLKANRIRLPQYLALLPTVKKGRFTVFLN